MSLHKERKVLGLSSKFINILRRMMQHKSHILIFEWTIYSRTEYLYTMGSVPHTPVLIFNWKYSVIISLDRASRQNLICIKNI